MTCNFITVYSNFMHNMNHNICISIIQEKLVEYISVLHFGVSLPSWRTLKCENCMNSVRVIVLHNWYGTLNLASEENWFCWTNDNDDDKSDSVDSNINRLLRTHGVQRWGPLLHMQCGLCVCWTQLWAVLKHSTNLDAVLGVPKEPCLRWGPGSQGEVATY